MKIKVTGEMTVPQVRQALYEQLREMEERFAIRHLRDITLYVTPTNGFGDEVLCRDEVGREISTLHCRGPYRSITEDYDI